MPNDFFSPEGDLEEHFITDYWLVDQYIGDTLWAWGDNYSGNIGDNTRVARSTPRQEITNSTNWKVTSAGFNSSSFAIKTDGTLWAWGINQNATIGDNTRVARSTPRQISAGANRITGWKQVSTGYFTSIAVRDDGTLWSWGSNNYGQLGNNLPLSTFRSTPIQITIASLGGSNGWKYVTGGDAASCAIREDGSLWCWGFNITGQVGDNTVQYRSTPRQISIAVPGGLYGWKQVSSGREVVAAIRNDGTMWAWGLNVGDNTGEFRSTPRQVSIAQPGGLYGWKQLSCGYNGVAAIRNDGTLWSWGDNEGGQIGDNTRSIRLTPVQEITSSTNWKYVSANVITNASVLGGSSIGRTCAIKTDGTLWAWGWNNYGQLGDNTTEPRSTPRQEITSSTNWKQVSSGGYAVLAVKAGVELN